jgi:hypothetical protein
MAKSLYFLVRLKIKVIFLPRVSQPVCPGISLPSGISHQFFFIFLGNYLSYQYGETSLKRGRFCNLLVQVQLGLASAVTLSGPRPVGLVTDYILLSRLRLGSLSVAFYNSPGYGGGILDMGFVILSKSLL